MTDPKPAPRRRNPSKPADEMRADADLSAKLAAANKVAVAWVKLCQNEPIAAELLVPRELRDPLTELVEAVKSP